MGQVQLVLPLLVQQRRDMEGLVHLLQSQVQQLSGLVEEEGVLMVRLLEEMEAQGVEDVVVVLLEGLSLVQQIQGQVEVDQMMQLEVVLLVLLVGRVL